MHSDVEAKPHSFYVILIILEIERVCMESTV